MNFYHYRCELVRVVDGDTIVVDVDKGFNDWSHNQFVRLYGINCPETRGPTREAGLRAKQFAEDWLAGRKDLWLWSKKYDEREKYGRVLAMVMRGDDPVSLNDALLHGGDAVAVSY